MLPFRFHDPVLAQMAAAADATRATMTDEDGNPAYESGIGATTVGFYDATPVTKPTVTGSKGGNAALASLIAALASQGLITDTTS
jgi:hypothetical protein